MRTVALFGQPLNRQHSAVMHNAAFQAAGLPVRYELREVDAEGLAKGVAEARRDGWLGFQVTAPHKQAVMALLDEVEPDAKRIGAVNTVVVDEAGRLVGINTDVLGFMTGLRDCLDHDLAGRKVVVAGSGGVGHAAAFGLAMAGVQRLTVLDVDAAMPRRLAAEFADFADLEPLSLDDQLVTARLGEADVFVNATSVGMLTPGPVIQVHLLNPRASVFDVVYIPSETELVRQARARALRACNGAAMLVAQAATAWCRWTGLDDPSGLMRAAVQPLLTRDDLQA